MTFEKTLYEKIGRAQLLLLATHLEDGELGHSRFDFGHYNGNGNGADAFGVDGCATNGCAVGELPILFPESWKFVRTKLDFDGSDLKYTYAPVYMKMPRSSQQWMAAEFFGVTISEADGLFLPNVGRPWQGGLLSRRATQYAVAESIRLFVAWKDRESSWMLRLLRKVTG